MNKIDQYAKILSDVECRTRGIYANPNEVERYIRNSIWWQSLSWFKRLHILISCLCFEPRTSDTLRYWQINRDRLWWKNDQKQQRKLLKSKTELEKQMEENLSNQQAVEMIMTAWRKRSES